MNYFVEGLQGSGKSTLVEKIAKKYSGHTVIREGDYSPVELAWCAYVSNVEYQEIVKKYSDIRLMVEEKSHAEKDHMIICYTQVITDIPGFHKDLENYEIYNGRCQFEEFRRIISMRYKNWNGEDMIFECSLLQNMVEDMILYRNLSDSEIMDFYKELGYILQDKDYRIMYLYSENIDDNIGVIRKERSDDEGNEMWFPLMVKYFDESPFARERGVSGEEELLKHFSHRQELELRICREIFPDRVSVLKSKAYTDDEL